MSLVLKAFGKTMRRRSSGEDDSTSQNSLDDHAQSSAEEDSHVHNASSNINISSAEAISLEVDGVVEPSDYVCEYEGEAARDLAMLAIAEELEEIDHAEGLIEDYREEDGM
eukprot:CAMPEP_0119027666 /NCGR_PEP_ID=MMETSP1176-20130426/37509_1 /TAXON_ID=265551 /ORGANISM="Synedropsis recta cf, Strain CCMP1620" /LENGTH=110 /DNA_ID=CAMNT_0006983631 /DNA_START=286 /DNA_END=618 /DNA_ORIENTATION=-